MLIYHTIQLIQINLIPTTTKVLQEKKDLERGEHENYLETLLDFPKKRD